MVVRGFQETFERFRGGENIRRLIRARDVTAQPRYFIFAGLRHSKVLCSHSGLLIFVLPICISRLALESASQL